MTLQRYSHGFTEENPNQLMVLFHGLQKAITSKVAKVLNVPTEELPSAEMITPCEKSEDLDKFIELLKEKCHHASRKEKIKLLTLVPSSWSIKKTMEEFNISQYMVKRAREIKNKKGILEEPDPKKGKSLSPEVIERVIVFYQSDDYSHMCPGKKEYVSVRIDGEREQKQKHLLLVNLKELHLEFIHKSTGDEISFSKFCELRPKWCVTVNSRGMHSVCVCQQHQNVKLLMAAIPDNCDYKEYLAKLVCSIENRTCMMQSCDSCPGKTTLIEYLTELFSTNDFDMDDIINYKQWMHTDRTNLVSLQISLQEFIDAICDAIDSLRQHHFVAKSQSSYLHTLKKNLPQDTAIVLLDFAENYSFLIQDAIQCFYWDNSQATLHPFAIYHMENGKIKCTNVVIISDCMKHDTSTVHAFISRLISYVKEELP